MVAQPLRAQYGMDGRDRAVWEEGEEDVWEEEGVFHEGQHLQTFFKDEFVEQRNSCWILLNETRSVFCEMLAPVSGDRNFRDGILENSRFIRYGTYIFYLHISVIMIEKEGSQKFQFSS